MTREGSETISPIDVPNGRVRVQFRVPYELSYLETYDPDGRKVIVREEVEKTEDGSVIVEKGDTAAFLLRKLDVSSLLVVQNFRNKSTQDNVRLPGALVQEAYLENGKLKEKNVAKISRKRPRKEVEGLGVFTWTELVPER